ncbi:MAG: sulfatase, partial [Bacteroidaceae bacterium]|nr:sulfatase [Bacteroidaceae bacterium]
MRSILNKRIVPAAVALAAGTTVWAQADKRPNIVVIIADDLGTNELGCYGGQNISTPHIDRLAREGVMLTNNFASMAVSVPIRASLYTGLYPQHSGVYQNHKSTYAGTRTVTHYLGDLGYRVGRAGKNHPVGQPVIYDFEKVPGFVEQCTASHPKVSTPEGLREFVNRDKKQPFCLFVCSIHSHAPWDAGDPTEFNPDSLHLPPNCVDNTVTRNHFCNYLGEIRLLDNEVGMTMRVLEESGQLDNTLVIFLGEQGPQMPFGKWTCYRYGQHSAFIARYPRQIKAGTVSDALVQYEDILPTLIDFAGGKPVEGLDGTSALNILRGEGKEIRQWAYGMHNNIPEGPAYPIRSIQDKRYKLIW